jgi:hypothetical protein
VSIHFEIISPAPRDAWSRVLRSDPAATIYQTPTWFDAARNACSALDVSRLYTLSDGRQLIFPMLRKTLMPGLALDHAYPYGLGAGGLLASEGLRPSDVKLVLADLLNTQSSNIWIKANHDRSEIWEKGLVPEAKILWRRVEVVDLEGGYERVWQRFHSSARRAIRKAERSDLDIERDTSGRCVSTFYDLYLSWTRRRAEEAGLPGSLTTHLARRRQPLRNFKIIAAALGENCRVWVARHRGEAVASIITLVFGRHAVYWSGYSDKALAGPLRANNLLQGLAIQDACEAGCRYYSMGESGGVSPLIQFKQTFGATPRSTVGIRLERVPLTAIDTLRSRTVTNAARLIQVTRKSLPKRN